MTRVARAAGAMAFAVAAGPATVPTGVREVAVSFAGEGGTPLAGTLALPAAAGGRRRPAVVLLAGSGPTDRDGNQPPLLQCDLLRTLAHRLARGGVASVRYDKRGMYANRAARPADPAALSRFYAWSPFVGDARAALEFVRGRPEVDPARVGLVGHSEGGLLALCVGGGPEPRPAALVLLATPGRPTDQLIHDQLTALLKAQHATPAQATAILDANAAIVDSLRATGQLPPGGVPPGLAALYPTYLSPFWHEQLAVDPPALAAAYAGPVLVVNGAADRQVSPDRDAAALDAALARRPGRPHQLLVVPAASHLLKPTTGPAADGVTGDVPADTLDGIAVWVAEHL